MVTYFFDETTKLVKMIDYGVVELTEEEKNNPHKIQLEKEYIVPYKENNSYELFVENGQIKHRYIPIVLTENEQIKALENENLNLKKTITGLESKVKTVQLAIAELYASESETTNEETV